MAQRRKKRNNRLPAALRWLLIGMMALGVAVLLGVLIYWRFFGANTEQIPEIELNNYDASAFYEENGFLRYRGMTHMVGIDVSEHQTAVDWQKVRDSGVEFVILRLGYRGYTEGGVDLDIFFLPETTSD